MGEEGPEPASKKPEGEKTKEGGLQDVREEGHSSTGNHRWVQGLMKGDMIGKYGAGSFYLQRTQVEHDDITM